jgi:hypothetical protein
LRRRAAFLPAIPAQATQAASLTRTFVSSAGNDSNPCTITQPCATFAQAYSLTAAQGIIAALDPGKYGPLTITGPVTINGYGWAAITAPIADRGITINANAGDVVTLTGLEIDGANAGGNGIQFNSGGSLNVRDCVIQNFTSDGILFQPAPATIGFVITNTILSNNLVGIHYQPIGGPITARGLINNVVESDGTDGVIFNLSPGDSVNVVIKNSVFNRNSHAGIVLDAGGASAFGVSIDNISTTSNDSGIIAIGALTVLLGRSVISFNNNGVKNQTSPNLFFSYQDNRIDGNNNDISSALNNTRALR